MSSIVKLCRIRSCAKFHLGCAWQWHVCEAFSKCAEAFRPEVERQLHHNSRTSERIERFWSHSWHGGAMNKILTLLVLYNSQIAVCLGSAASLLMTFLFSMGFLPGLSRVTSVPEYQFSSWSLGSGALTSLLCRCFFYRFSKCHDCWLRPPLESLQSNLCRFFCWVVLVCFVLLCEDNTVLKRESDVRFHCQHAELCSGDHSNWSFLIVFALVKAILC